MQILVLGHFDISVRNPLTPGNITSFTAGAAGLHGEAHKNAKHFSDVCGRIWTSVYGIMIMVS